MLKYLGAKGHNGNFNANVQSRNSNECLCDSILKRDNMKEFHKNTDIWEEHYNEK